MIPVVAHDVREIPIELVDDPELTMRETFDDEKFLELVDDIKANGVQVPLIVERRGDRYRVCAGHRRITACRRLGASTVPCDVREPGALDAEAIKILENDVREQVNAAEGAMYLARLYVERCHEDVDELCALVRRSRRYVEDRLLVWSGDAEILEALKARQIGLGVALELNGISNAMWRRGGLDIAVRSGMTMAAAKQYKRDANRAAAGQTPATDTSASGDATAAAPITANEMCYVCARSDHPERMRWIRVHEHCDLAILERLVMPFRTAEAEVLGE